MERDKTTRWWSNAVTVNHLLLAVVVVAVVVDVVAPGPGPAVVVTSGLPSDRP